MLLRIFFLIICLFDIVVIVDYFGVVVILDRYIIKEKIFDNVVKVVKSVSLDKIEEYIVI